MSLFLEQFAKTISADEHAVMIWDGAGFHTTKKLQAPPNISLLKLPAYSPELNPIENLGHYLKSHYCSNRAYPDYDALEDAAMKALRIAALNTQFIKTACAGTYLDRATSN